MSGTTDKYSQVYKIGTERILREDDNTRMWKPTHSLAPVHRQRISRLFVPVVGLNMFSLQTNAPFIFQNNVSDPSRCESRLFLGIGLCTQTHRAWQEDAADTHAGIELSLLLRGWAFYSLNLVLPSSLQQENRNWDKYFTAQRSDASRGTCVSITGRADKRSPSTLWAPPVKNNALNELSSRSHGLRTLARHPSHPLGKSQCADSGGNQYTWNSAVEPSEWMQICGGRKFLQVSYSRRREHIQLARRRARQWRSPPARWVAFRATHPHTLAHARARLLCIADLDMPVQRHFLAQMREEVGLQSVSLWQKHKFKNRTSLSHYKMKIS